MNDKPVYLVSNIHRSGSSMMIRCLEAGGMDAAYDQSQEHLNVVSTDNGYVPNQNGFYALDEDFRRPDLAQKYAGKALKLPFRDLTSLPAARYKLLFIKRNPDSIRASMAAFSPYISWEEDSMVLEFYDEVVGTILAQLQARGDIDIIVMNYEDIVSQPAWAFQTLQSRGWPLDPAAAAATVDPTLHHFRLEEK